MLDENNITDEQIDKFFQSGGEIAPDELSEAEKETATQDEGTVNTPKSDKEAAAPEKPSDAVIQERDNYRRAMEAERIQRKESQKQLSALLEEIKQLKESMTPKKEENDINFEEEPLESLRHKTEELTRKQQEYDSRIQSEEEKRKAQEEYNAFASEVSIKVHEFAKEKPDYYQAIDYLKEARVAELKLHDLTDKQIQETIAQDELFIAAKAIDSGKNPAEVAYNLARHRGYISKTQEQINQSSEKLDRIERGSTLSKSLGGKGGGTVIDLSVDSIAGMSEADIDRLISDEDSWNKLANVF